MTIRLLADENIDPDLVLGVRHRVDQVGWRMHGRRGVSACVLGAGVGAPLARLQRRSRLERGSIHLQILLPNNWAYPKVHAIGGLGDEPDPFRISQIIDALTDIMSEQEAGSVAILTTMTDRGLPGERESAWCRALWNQLRDAPFRSWPLFHATADGSVGLVPLDQLLSGELAEGY